MTENVGGSRRSEVPAGPVHSGLKLPSVRPPGAQSPEERETEEVLTLIDNIMKEAEEDILWNRLHGECECY